MTNIKTIEPLLIPRELQDTMHIGKQIIQEIKMFKKVVMNL